MYAYKSLHNLSKTKELEQFSLNVIRFLSQKAQPVQTKLYAHIESNCNKSQRNGMLKKGQNEKQTE